MHQHPGDDRHGNGEARDVSRRPRGGQMLAKQEVRCSRMGRRGSRRAFLGRSHDLEVLCDLPLFSAVADQIIPFDGASFAPTSPAALAAGLAGKRRIRRHQTSETGRSVASRDAVCPESGHAGDELRCFLGRLWRTSRS
jgi:hypothetical protein